MAFCPAALVQTISPQLSALRTALDELTAAYSARTGDFVIRPALFLYAHIASAIYLLEHGVWVYTMGEASTTTDIAVLNLSTVGG